MDRNYRDSSSLSGTYVPTSLSLAKPNHELSRCFSSRLELASQADQLERRLPIHTARDTDITTAPFVHSGISNTKSRSPVHKSCCTHVHGCFSQRHSRPQHRSLQASDCSSRDMPRASFVAFLPHARRFAKRKARDSIASLFSPRFFFRTCPFVSFLFSRQGQGAVVSRLPSS